MASQFILHTGPELITLILGDHHYRIAPDEPFEVEDGQFYTDKLLEIYGVQYGLIECVQAKSRTGITIDIEAELERAEKYLEDCEIHMLNEYVNGQRTERIAHNLPAIPPQGRVAEIIKARKVDLKKKYNIELLGTEGFVDKEKEALIAENKALKSQIAGHTATLDTILARIGNLETAKSAPPQK